MLRIGRNAPLQERRQKRALADVAIAKGGLSESQYIKRIDAHRKARRALITLSRDVM